MWRNQKILLMILLFREYIFLVMLFLNVSGGRMQSSHLSGEIINSNISESVLMEGVSLSGISEHPLEKSLLGTDTKVIGRDGKGAKTELFVGEKCRIQL